MHSLSLTGITVRSAGLIVVYGYLQRLHTCGYKHTEKEAPSPAGSKLAVSAQGQS